MGRKDNEHPQRDRAGVGPHVDPAEHLVPLKELDDFKVADGEPDIRGWDVQTLSGRKIGTVDDLLIDVDRNQALMMRIDLDGTDRSARAPVRAAQVDRSRKLVLVDSEDVTEIADADEDEEDSDSDALRAARREERAARVERAGASGRTVRYPESDTQEVVVDRRPLVEEIVVRRRVADPDSEAAEAADEAERARRKREELRGEAS